MGKFGDHSAMHVSCLIQPERDGDCARCLAALLVARV